MISEVGLERPYMDSSSLANTPSSSFRVSIAHVYPVSCSRTREVVLDLDGLFARRVPIESAGSRPRTFSGLLGAGSTC